ncbi:MAG TPA: hypothetical protein VLI69_05530 [Gammaproteobacteria bacterium]|nr:hypothetical protein [Gammaproteobacteria bacterium]
MRTHSQKENQKKKGPPVPPPPPPPRGSSRFDLPEVKTSPLHNAINQLDLQLIHIHSHYLFNYLKDCYLQSDYLTRETKYNTKNPCAQLIQLLETYNSYFSADNHITSHSISLANITLDTLKTRLPNYFTYSPLIQLFHEICLIQTGCKQDQSILVLDEVFLKTTRETLQKLTADMREYFSETPLTLSILKNFLAALDILNLWQEPKAVHMHQYGSTSLKIANHCWKFILSEIDSFFCSRKLEDLLTMKYLTSRFIRPLMNLHHDQMQKRLKKIRSEARVLQGEETILYEKANRLEETIEQQDHLKQENDLFLSTHIEQELKNEKNYKEALTRVAVSVSPYGKFFKGINPKTLPSAIIQIVQLSNTKSTAQAVSEKMANPEWQEEKKEQPKNELYIPVVTTDLFSLKSLKNINQETSVLLKALKDISLYYPSKRKFRTELVNLIETFNDCFVKRLTDEVRIEKSNICLQDLMLHMRHSPMLIEFETEDNQELKKHVSDFFIFYTKTLEAEFITLNAILEDIKKTSSDLKQKIQTLENQIAQCKLFKDQSETLPANTQQIHPYEKALINITAVILSATDIQNYPQFIPVSINILRNSYEALLQFNQSDKKEENPSTTFHFSIPEEQDFFENTVELPQNSLPWESLLFLNAYSKVVLDTYNNHRPKNTDFCTEIKRQLEKFNGYFTPENLKLAPENIQAEANATLTALTKYISDAILTSTFDSLSFEFYRVYQYEEKQITDSKPLSLFNWEHLKQLNKASQTAALEIKKWDTIEYGRLNCVALLTGAINYFSTQLTINAVDENKNALQSANKAWLCLIFLINRICSSISYLDMVDYKLFPYVVQMTRLTENTIEQLIIQLREKNRDHYELQKAINDLKKSTLHDRKQKAALSRHIKTIVSAKMNHEPASLHALKNIMTELSTPKNQIEKNILLLAQSGFYDLTEKTSCQIQPDLEEKVYLNHLFPPPPEEMMNSAFLYHHLNDAVSYLLKDLYTVSKKNKPIQTLIGYLEIFQKDIREKNCDKQINEYLRLIVRDMSHMIDLGSLDKIIRWHFQLFLSEYAYMITEYLQYLHQKDHELTEKIGQLNTQIDRMNQQQNSYLLFSDQNSLIQKALKEERVQSKPAEDAIKKIAALIFSLNENEINSTLFSVIVKIFQSINHALYGSDCLPQETYTFRMN